MSAIETIISCLIIATNFNRNNNDCTSMMKSTFVWFHSYSVQFSSVQDSNQRPIVRHKRECRKCRSISIALTSTHFVSNQCHSCHNWSKRLVDSTINEQTNRDLNAIANCLSVSFSVRFGSNRLNRLQVNTSYNRFEVVSNQTRVLFTDCWVSRKSAQNSTEWQRRTEKSTESVLTRNASLISKYLHSVCLPSDLFWWQNWCAFMSWHIYSSHSAQAMPLL